MKDSNLETYPIFTKNFDKRVRLYFSTDLNSLRENYLLPFLDSYLKMKDDNLIRYKFYLIIRKLINLDIDEIFINTLELNYKNFNRKNRQTIDFGIAYLLKFYGIFITMKDNNLNNHVNLKKFIKRNYGKKSFADFSSLSNGNYKISKNKYYN